MVRGGSRETLTLDRVSRQRRRKTCRPGLQARYRDVREVYEIDSWHPAATTPYATRDAALLKTAARREFLGRVADATVRNAYVGRSVASQFPQGLQSPVVYVNC